MALKLDLRPAGAVALARATRSLGFPVHVVKIDRSFVDKMVADAEVRAIVSAVINLAKSLDIEVVAEGVESEKQKRMLLRLGCRLGQGYHFGRPTRGAEIRHILETADRRRVA